MPQNSRDARPVRKYMCIAALGLCFALAPAVMSAGPIADMAMAKNQGKGGGGGNGKGHSSNRDAADPVGDSGKHGKAGAKSADPFGLGSFADSVFGGKKGKSSKHAKSQNRAKQTQEAKQKAKTKSPEEETEEELETAKLPGKLNAAHASPTARLNAAPNSAVGQIAAYEKAKTEALASGDEEAIKAANDMLGELTNKELDEKTIAALDDLLGIAAPDNATFPEGEEPPAGAPTDDLAQAPADDSIIVQE